MVEEGEGRPEDRLQTISLEQPRRRAQVRDLAAAERQHAAPARHRGREVVGHHDGGEPLPLAEPGEELEQIEMDAVLTE